MAIELTDDGTLDTVLRCSECGEEMRYNYDAGPDADERALELRAEYLLEHPDAKDSDANEHADTTLYDEWVAGCIEDATADHECVANAEPSEPEEGDITTSDHETFWQNGRIVLQRFGPRWRYYYDAQRVYDWLPDRAGDDCNAALRAYMERVQFWPNVWFISDHGNAHLMDLSEGK